MDSKQRMGGGSSFSHRQKARLRRVRVGAFDFMPGFFHSSFFGFFRFHDLNPHGLGTCFFEKS